MKDHPTEQENLIDLTRAEDFTDKQLTSCYSETDRERATLNKLKGAGAHLLEGPRGVGKSTLLKKAELELDDEFSQKKIMGVYVNFKSALLVDANSEDIHYNPFICWVVAKIMDSFYRKARSLHVLTSQDIGERYNRLLGISSTSTAKELEDIINDLRGLSTAGTPEKHEEIVKRLKSKGLDNFANIEGIANFVRSVVKDKGLLRVDFLFDEAAHTFDEQQQEMFFELFKLLQGDVVSVKAAVYPGITSYGGNFEIGQDAVRLSISSVKENLDQARQDLKIHFRELLQKRLPNSEYGKLVKRGEALDLLILLSNGNPRMFLQSASKFLSGREYSKRSALAASNEFVASELVSYHMGLKTRLPRFASHIDLGMDLIKAHLVPELQKKNEGKGEDPNIQTVYFTIDQLVHYKVKKSINLLEYSGFLYSKSVVKTAKRKQASRYALHLGVAANDKIFHTMFSRDPDHAISKLSIADYREFYATDSRFNELVTNHPSLDSCPNGHPRQTDGNFCPICGQQFKLDNIVEDLLSEPFNKLYLTKFLLTILREEFEVNTVRDVLDLTESTLQSVHRIGPVRSKQIVNAAEEFITG